MFYYISGKVAVTEGSLVVIDAGGVGYAVNTSYTSARSVRVGDTATFYTYLHVREELMELYGFARREELSCFKQLIAISGVGPKAALSILSATTPANLALSIITGDEKALTCAQGVGKKIAQRVILELKDKLAAEEAGVSGKGSVPVTIGGLPHSKKSEATAALAVLGYGSAEIAAVLKDIDMDALSLEDVIRQALKKMMK